MLAYNKVIYDIKRNNRFSLGFKWAFGCAWNSGYRVY